MTVLTVSGFVGDGRVVTGIFGSLEGFGGVLNERRKAVTLREAFPEIAAPAEVEPVEVQQRKPTREERKTARVLLKAAKIVEAGWAQGSLRTYDNRFCAVGAIERVAWRAKTRGAAFSAVLPDSEDPREDLIEFNDRQFSLHGQTIVARKFRDTAARIEAGE